MICPKCGFETEIKALFCPRCGTKLVEKEAQTIKQPSLNESAPAHTQNSLNKELAQNTQNSFEKELVQNTQNALNEQLENDVQDTFEEASPIYEASSLFEDTPEPETFSTYEEPSINVESPSYNDSPVYVEPSTFPKKEPEKTKRNSSIVLLLLLAVIIVIGIFMSKSKGTSDVADDGDSSSVTTEYNNDDVDEPTTTTEAVETDWDRVVESGKLRVGITTNSQYKIDLIDAVCNQMGLDADIRMIDFEDRFSLDYADVDCTLCGKNSLKSNTFSDPLAEVNMSLVVNKKFGGNAKGQELLGKLSNATIVVAKLTKGQSVAEAYKEFEDAYIIEASSTKEALQMVNSGEADATIIRSDKNVSKYSKVYKNTGVTLKYRSTFCCEQGSELVEHLNSAIEALNADGTLEDILAGSDI